MMRNRMVPSLIATAVCIAGLSFASGAAALVSTKLALSEQFGLEVDLTEVGAKGGPEKEDICTAASLDVCQSGKAGGEARALNAPYSVATGPNGDVYVADTNNRRIQVFAADGTFVSTFGAEVDKTTKGDVCTRVSGDVCQAGTAGALSGQISEGFSVAVDQGDGHVYVLDVGDLRVDEYTAEGEFLLMMGGEVNQTKDNEAGASEAERNVCTKASGNVCKIGVASLSGVAEHGAFKPAPDYGNLLAVGPGGLLYVGDEERVQELEASGKWIHEVSLKAIAPGGVVRALDVDSVGDLDVAYSVKEVTTVYEYNSSDALRGHFTMANQPLALTLDPAGHLAIVEAGSPPRAVLVDATGALLAEIRPPVAIGFADGLAFNANDELYVADTTHQDVERYIPVPVAKVLTLACKNQKATETTLVGTVNPENIGETKGFFEYGKTATLGLRTPTQPIADGTTPTQIEALLVGLRPNETYGYRAVAEDANDHAPEPPLLGETRSCSTLYVAPQIEGEPSSYDVTFGSAVLFGEVNPENARTLYRFQYGACQDLEACPSELETPPLESSAYATIGAMQTATGLTPGTAYRYRLVAESESRDKSEKLEALPGSEGAFVTSPAPSPTAATGPATGVTATGARLSGVVDPDGVPVSYSFEVGVYNGGATVYGTVASGSVEPGSGPVSEGFEVTGLQAGVTYAYRLVVSSAYVANAAHALVGEPVIFTTAGLPAVLVAPMPLAMLPVPNIVFPKPAMKGGKAAKAKKATTKHRHTARKGRKARKQGHKARNAHRR
jgi:hypothetical protein